MKREATQAHVKQLSVVRGGMTFVMLLAVVGLLAADKWTPAILATILVVGVFTIADAWTPDLDDTPDGFVDPHGQERRIRG